jgi:hypothetical protein
MTISGGKPKNSEMNQLQCHFDFHESGVKSPGIESLSARLEGNVQPPELPAF